MLWDQRVGHGLELLFWAIDTLGGVSLVLFRHSEGILSCPQVHKPCYM